MPRDSVVAMAATRVLLLVAIGVIWAAVFRRGTESFAAATMRPCAVYYTKNTDLCDRLGHLYEKTPQWRTWRINEIQKMPSPSEEDKKELAALVQIQAETPAPPKYCKLEFPGFTENAADPRKIAPDAAVRGPTEHWAFCFKANPDRSAAEQSSRQFGDRGAVYTNDEFITTMNDAFVYNRIQFRKLDFDAVKYSKCVGERDGGGGGVGGGGGGLQDGLPLLIGIKVDPFTMKASDILAFQRGANGQLAPYSNPLALFARLFRTYGENYQYLMGPVRTQAVVYKISKNVCDQDVVYNTVPIAVDLGQIGLGKETIVPGLPYAAPNRATMIKSVSEIQERINGVAATLKEVEDKYAAITAKSAGGLNRFVYLIQTPDHWPQNTAQMDALFANRVRLVRQDTDTIVHFRHNTRVPGVAEGYAMEWRGMFRAPASGNYWFKVNSDDAADAYVNGTLVTTYYGGHGFGDAGVSLAPVRMNAGEFYSVHIRMMEWWGGDGMELSVRSDAPGVGTGWQLVPTAWFYYASDPNINTYVTQIDYSRQQLKQLEERKKGYEHWMTQLQGNQGKILEKYVAAMRDRDVSAVFHRTHLSDDQIIYLDVGAYLIGGVDGADGTDRQVLLQEPVELNVQRTLSTPQVPLHQTPNYTIAMWVKVNEGATFWRNVVFFGAQDDWTDWQLRKNNNPLIDRTPGFWIYPDRTTRLHYRHRALTDGGFNDGIDVTDPAKLPPFNQWFHYATAIRGNTAKTYINGKLVESRTLAANFEWNDIRKKQFSLGGNYGGGSRGVYVQRLYWYNRALGDDEIANLAKEVSVNRVTEVNVRSVGWGGCSAEHYSSGRVLINHKAYSFVRGINVYTVTDGNATWSQWDSYANQINTGGGKSAVLSALAATNLAKHDVLVVLIHDEGNNIMTNDVRNLLIQQGSSAINSIGFRSPYLFIKDLRRNKVYVDRAGKSNACDSLEWNGGVE